MPGPGRDIHIDKNMDMVTPLKKLFGYLKHYRHYIFTALFCLLVSTVLAVVGPREIGKMSDVIKDGLADGIDMSQVARVGVVLLAIYLASALANYFSQLLMALTTLHTTRRMRADLSAKINRVPQDFFNRNTQGDILSRITNDVGTAASSLSQSLPTIISAIITLIGCLVMMILTDWHLTLCIIGLSLIGLIAIGVIMGHSQKYFVARQKNLGDINGYIEEMYTCHEIVRSSRAVGKVFERFEGYNKAVYDSNWKSQFISGIMQPIMMVIGNLCYVVVCVYGASLAMQGVIRFGVIVSFILYARMFSSPLTQIAQGMTNLQSAAAAASRVFAFLEHEELSDESDKEPLGAVPKGAVVFDHVRFAYPEVPDKVIIKDFSAVVKPGQKVAIVGPTGAGKTTMVNLLMRFYEINQGRISIDGRPISELPREEVHRMFGMVLQDTWLFEGTVRENLVYNLEGITDADLERVARACGIAHFIHSLPQGFDTVLSENTTISAGQKQLFTIARAMLQNSPMLILDEATSSVDTRTELIIQRTMDELTRDRTSFIIAHRLSTIRNADLILVMQEGDVVESGTHEELLARGGAYAALYNSQFAAT